MIWLIIIGALLPSFARAQEGVNFRNLTFEQALVVAKEENKLVFVDCYTSWCAPCKYMSDKIFTKKEAGDYFNPRFVCVKFDMEKGEGRKLARLFNVSSYPTFVIVRPDGVVQHKLVGGNGLDEFVLRVEKGIGAGTNLLHMNRLYATGQMNEAQLMDYYSVLLEAGEKRMRGRIYKELWQRLPGEEKVKAQYWPLFIDENCVTGSEAFDFLLAHLQSIRANVGREKVDAYLTDYYENILDNQILGYVDADTPSIDLLEEQVPSLGVEKQEELNQLLVLAGMVVRRQVKELRTLIEKRMPGMTPAELALYASGYRGILWRGKSDVPKCYEHVGKVLTKLTVKKMTSERLSLTVNDMEEYLSAISMFGGKMSKQNRKRVVKVGDEVLIRDEDSAKAAHVKFVMDQYRHQKN